MIKLFRVLFALMIFGYLLIIYLSIFNPHIGPVANIFIDILIVFVALFYFYTLFFALYDIYKNKGISGFTWFLLIFLVPFLGAYIYFEYNIFGSYFFKKREK